MFYVITILAFIFILGSAVVIHEFGHFIVAKLLRIRVETFSVGFGPRIWGRRWGTTDYRLSAIPLGGYVKLGGDESNAGIEGEGESNIPANERFDLRPRYQKFLVGVAGPVMNILTAIAIPLVGAMATGIPQVPAPIVGELRPGGVAEVAGIKLGDRIHSFNGVEGRTWDKIYNDALISPDQEIPLVVERNGQQIPLTIKPRQEKGGGGGEVIGKLDFVPEYGDLPVLFHKVAENTPAERAGLKSGDYVLAINDKQIRNKEQVLQFLQEHKTEPFTVTVRRDGQEQLVKVGAERLPDGKLGVELAEEIPLQRVGPLTALSYAVDRNIEFMRLTGKALGQVFSGSRSVRDTFSGPIDIARASGRAANEGGWEGVFGMLAFLSLNLGVFNLLPIPVLDGGMIFMLFVEGILGWVGVKLSMGVRERIQQVGFVFLLLLMGFVIVNDVTKWAKGPSGSNEQPAATSSPAK